MNSARPARYLADLRSWLWCDGRGVRSIGAMQGPTHERQAVRDPSAVLGLLLDNPATHFSWHELAVELDWPAYRVEDAVAEVTRAGLAHPHGGFVFPTRAAVRCGELLV